MIGAIIGDIVGSSYEFATIRGWSLPLFTSMSRFTDDTILLCATTDAIVNKKPFADCYRSWFWRYRDARWSPRFENFCIDESQGALMSNGNGAAVRGIACGYLADNLGDALQLAYKAASCSHVGNRALGSAAAVAYTVFQVKNRIPTRQIEFWLYDTLGVDLKSINIDDTIERGLRDSSDCADTVSVAIKLGLESKNFVECMRGGIAMGGDVDTVLCIAGGIVQHRVTIGDMNKTQAVRRLPYKVLQFLLQSGGIDESDIPGH